jgi:hypothetical protein
MLIWTPPTDAGVHLVRPAAPGSNVTTTPTKRRLWRLRQWIEAIVDTLRASRLDVGQRRFSAVGRSRRCTASRS